MTQIALSTQQEAMTLRGWLIVITSITSGMLTTISATAIPSMVLRFFLIKWTTTWQVTTWRRRFKTLRYWCLLCLVNVLCPVMYQRHQSPNVGPANSPILTNIVVLRPGRDIANPHQKVVFLSSIRMHHNYDVHIHPERGTHSWRYPHIDLIFASVLIGIVAFPFPPQSHCGGPRISNTLHHLTIHRHGQNLDIHPWQEPLVLIPQPFLIPPSRTPRVVDLAFA